MTDIAVGGPLALDRFSLGGFWVPQPSTLTPGNSRAMAQGADGDSIATQLHNAGTTTSVPYINKETSGDLVLPNAGAISGGFHIDSCSLARTPEGWPILTVNGHQHDDNAHAASSAEFTPSLTMPAGFGVPETYSTLGSNAGMLSMTYDWGCDHNDEQDGSGDHLAGASYNGQETLSLGFTGTPTTPFTEAATWDITKNGEGAVSNTEFDKTSYEYKKSITRN